MGLILNGRKASPVISSIKGVGIGIAGQIDKGTGSVLFAPNLGWRNVPLKEILEKDINLPVFVMNDLTAITYGEWKRGAGMGVRDLLCIFVGTGIGSGIVINNRLMNGCSDTAGEIGHIVIVSGGRRCHCSNYGCLEAYAGGWGIAERTKEMAIKDPVGFKNIIDLAGGIENITAFTISKAYKLNDGLAVKIMEETGQYLSDGVITAVNLLNPCMVILGGGIIEGFPELTAIVKGKIKKRALKAATNNLTIAISKLGNDAGVIGAAGIAASKS